MDYEFGRLHSDYLMSVGFSEKAGEIFPSKCENENEVAARSSVYVIVITV